MHDLLSAIEKPVFDAYPDGYAPESTSGGLACLGIMPLVIQDGELVFRELGGEDESITITSRRLPSIQNYLTWMT